MDPDEMVTFCNVIDIFPSFTSIKQEIDMHCQDYTASQRQVGALKRE